MDYLKLIRNPEKVHAVIEELPDNRLVVKKPLKVYVPARFAERNLASVGIKTSTVGIFAMVVEDTYYAVCLVNAMVEMKPSSTTKVIIDDENYYCFSFEAGDTLITSLNLIKTDTLVYRIYAEIVAKGKVPWYLSYVDMSKIFDTASKHAGANIGKQHEVTELMVSIIARSKENRHLNYRHVVDDLKTIRKNPPAYIALKNLTYAATNTVARIGGSFFGDGLVSALTNPSERVERIESILRK